MSITLFHVLLNFDPDIIRNVGLSDTRMSYLLWYAIYRTDHAQCNMHAIIICLSSQRSKGNKTKLYAWRKGGLNYGILQCPALVIKDMCFEEF